MSEDDYSFYLFNPPSSNSIKEFLEELKCDPKKKKKSNKLQDKSTTYKVNRKKDKKWKTKKTDAVAVNKYKFFQPKVKTSSDVTFSPNTTFDRLLHSSRRPLAEKNSNSNSQNQIKSNNSANGPISPIFPTVNHLRQARLWTPVLRNSIESSEKSSRLPSVLSSCDSIFSNSPLLCSIDGSSELGLLKFFPSGVHNSNKAENRGEFEEAHKSENSSLSPIARRRRTRNIHYKITHSQDSSESFSNRLMRCAATENKECSMEVQECVTVVDKNNSNVTVCNSNDEDGSGGNVSSSVATDCSPENHKSRLSNSTHSLVRETEFSHSISSSVRKSVANNMTLTSHVSSIPNLTTPVHADSDNYIVNEMCDHRNELLKTELDSDISVRATASEVFMAVTPEVNQFSRTKKSTYSFSNTAVPSHIETCSPCLNETYTINVVPQIAHQEEELKALSSGTADIHELDYCKGQRLTHGMSMYCEKNEKKSLCNISRRSSICRKLSHVIIPDRRAQGSSNSNGSLPMPDKRSGFLSASGITEDEELDPDDFTSTRALGSARDMVLGRCNQSEPLTFEKAFPPRFFDNCKKIGEGVYGEVFFLSV